MKTKRKTTPAASALVASRNFLMTQPPLLAVMQGGDYSLHFQFVHGFYDRCTGESLADAYLPEIPLC